MDKVVGGDEAEQLASDGVSRHMGAWASFGCDLRLYPAQSLSDNSLRRGRRFDATWRVSLGLERGGKTTWDLVSDSPIHGELFVYTVRRCLEAGRARMVSIAPPLPVSTEVAGEKGSWDLVSQGPLLNDRMLEGQDGGSLTFSCVVHRVTG